MRSRWLPRLLLLALAVGLGAAIVSLSLGEHREAEFVIEGSGEVQELIGGIHQLDDRLGDDDAAITIDVFTDLHSERCADYQSDVVRPLIADYARTGEAQMILHHYPLGPKPVTLAGIGAEAAGEQDRQWQFADLFFRNLHRAPPEGVTREFMNEVAGGIPKLDVTAWEQEVDGLEAEERALADNDLGTGMELPANPVIIVTGPGGTEELLDAPSLEDVVAAIDAVS